MSFQDEDSEPESIMVGSTQGAVVETMGQAVDAAIETMQCMVCIRRRRSWIMLPEAWLF